MNKLILFPLSFLLILTLFSAIYTGEKYSSGPTQDYSNVTSPEIDGESSTVIVEDAGSFEFDLWVIGGIVAILTVAVSAGVAMGFNALGSGFSETSQKLVFYSILYGGIWACLTVVTSTFMFANVYTTVLWMALSIAYIMGFGNLATGTEA